jgi:hypothetical protein
MRSSPLPPLSPPAPGPAPRQDAFSRALAFAASAAATVATTAVARVTDVAAALVPDSVPRARVELAVKAGLMLLALAMLKSLLSVRGLEGWKQGGGHEWRAR